MQVRSEVQDLVLVWIRDQEVLELIREFLEPLGYSVEFAPEAEVTSQAQKPVPN
jgi:CheY-like chemotaxis protein